MRNLFYRLSPFTPDSAGAASFFAELPALVVPLDMNGTVSTFRNRVGVEDDSQLTMCSILGNREMSYVLGDIDGFVRECVELVERFGGKMIVLVHGPVSAMVGIDLVDLAYELEDVCGLPVYAVESSGNCPYEDGLEQAADSVLKSLGGIQAPDEPEEGLYNLLGINRVDHNSPYLRSLLEEQCGQALRAHETINWFCASDTGLWERSASAAGNVVASVSGLKLAKSLKRKWGIPFTFVDMLALPVVKRAAEVPGAQEVRPQRVLVVHEQLMGNVIRRVLEAWGCEVTVASFHTMLKERMSPKDIRLEDEWDLRRALKEGSFDAVFGDSALQACVSEGISFVPTSHTAVAHGGRWYTNAQVPLTDEWLELAASSLGR